MFAALLILALALAPMTEVGAWAPPTEPFMFASRSSIANAATHLKQQQQYTHLSLSRRRPISFSLSLSALHQATASSSATAASSSLPSRSSSSTRVGYRNTPNEDGGIEDLATLSRLQLRRFSPPFGAGSNTNKLQPQRTNNGLASASASTRRQRRFQVYCDLDGVLVDFVSGIQGLYNKEDDNDDSALSGPLTSQSVDALPRHNMWHRVAQADAFFEHLPWMDAGKSLWNVVKQLEPTILTGVPAYPESSRQQKVAWCRRELGLKQVRHTDKACQSKQHKTVVSYSTTTAAAAASASCTSSSPSSSSFFNLWSNDKKNHNKDKDAYHQQHSNNNACTEIITCWSNNKHYESGPGRVLIDDRIELKQAWEAKGGTFVHHKGCAVETIAQLQELGVLDEYACSSSYSC